MPGHQFMTSSSRGPGNQVLGSGDNYFLPRLFSFLIKDSITHIHVRCIPSFYKTEQRHPAVDPDFCLTFCVYSSQTTQMDQQGSFQVPPVNVTHCRNSFMFMVEFYRSHLHDLWAPSALSLTCLPFMCGRFSALVIGKPTAPSAGQNSYLN